MTPSVPTSRPVKLTVAMIVKDEEALLPGALASVRDAADEIVIVDTGSTDGTRRIAQEHGAVLVDFPWQHDFSAARNAAWPHVSGDWVLWLDAGERLPPGGGPVLLDFLEESAEVSSGYYVYVEVPPRNRASAAERCAKLRLMPAGSGGRFSGRTRETSEESLLALGMGLKMSPVTLLRTVAEHDEERKRFKARRDQALWDLEDQAAFRKPRCQIALAEIHATLGDHVASCELFQTALVAAPGGSTEQLEAWYGLLTSLPDADPQVRLNACLKALDAFPFDAQLLCATGHCLQQQGRLDLAARTYESAVNYGQIDPRTWHLAEIGEIAAHCLSTVCQLLGDENRSRQVLLVALARLPQSVRLRRSLIDLEVKCDRLTDALAQVEKLPATVPHREALKNAVRGACQAARRQWCAAEAYLATAYQQGCRESICLRWRVAALRGLDRVAEARQFAQDWLAGDPDSAEAQRCLNELQLAATNCALTVRIDDSQPLLDPALLSPQLAANLRSLRTNN